VGRPWLGLQCEARGNAKCCARGYFSKEINVSDVTYQQSHTLGLEKARELARHWMSTSATELGLNCQHEQGADQDTITFERMGVKGIMKVTGTEFDLKVTLGMIMAAFKPMIEAEVSRNLGRIIAKAEAMSQNKAPGQA
jgi:putative polyhydroxyalkanoate system protein